MKIITVNIPCMSKVIVLGSGMVGRAMAIDMSSRHEVSLADRDQYALENAKLRCPALHTLLMDVTRTEVMQNTIADYDLVICAVPGFLGFETIRAIIEAGKDVVDISFFAENSLSLDALAKEKNVTAIVDCGVAPGMHNLIAGYHHARMKITDFECLVGGLPKIRKWPFAYKAPFSPIDVIEEYTRPARFVEGGQLVVREALSDCEPVDFDRVGTLEAFNSDGLRTLIDTLPDIPNMKEKTLRYPGHVEYVRVLKESGFFSQEKITWGNTAIEPLEFTSRILFNDWKLGDTEEEITLMRITITGEDKIIVYNLYDEYEPESQTSSMARTTGYTATAAANMFLEGLFTKKGIFPPELIGSDETCFQYIMNYLKERNIYYKVSETSK